MADAVDSATGVAAPLLGGFTLTLIGLIVSGPEDFRWAGWALLLLTLAVLLFVTCVQAGFWARRSRPESFVQLAEYYATSTGSYRIWVRVASDTYDTAIVLLFCGLGAVLAPVGQRDVGLRWVASGMCFAAAVAEVVWHFVARRRGRAQ